eukprot:TRINITY_DN12572_c0_g1_i2.p1 TRINITY_DN12572_c0_g1~~TRINITY_DN12572_c0_g1_i2.p1  ORF type:complete len:505 (+),score=83.50 TRINITY_DN12572_c0_g1_i2:56-1570(+)
MRRLLGRFWSWVEQRVTSPGDTPETVQVKKVLFTGIGAIPVFLLINRLGTGTWDNLGPSGVAFMTGFAGALCFLVGVLTKRPVEVVVPCFVLAVTQALLLADWEDASRLTSRPWGFVVVLLDLCLVACPTVAWLQLVVIAEVILYHFVVSVEQSYRFGMFDAIWDASGRITVCDCSNPPCSTKFPTYQLVVAIATLLLDYHFTRGFERELRRQLQRIRAAVQVSEDVAAEMCKYNVDRAEAVVWGPEGDLLPDGLQRAYGELLRNLRAYRSYLPQSCLVSQPDECSESEAVKDEVATDAPQSNRSNRSLSASASVGVPRLDTRVDLFVAPKEKTVTLVSVNRTDFLQACRCDARPVSDWLAGDVEKFSEVTCGLHGVVDLVHGDHRYASFNAAKVCPRHAHKGVTCCFQLSECPPNDGASSSFDRLGRTCAVVTGVGLCGDFGPESLQRFMIVSSLPNLLQITERLAAHRREPVLVNEKAQTDVHTHWLRVTGGGRRNFPRGAV